MNREYFFTIVTNYMVDGGEYASCGTGGGGYASLADAVIAASEEQFNIGDGLWDGRGPKTINVEFVGVDGVRQGATFRHYGNWSSAVMQYALDWFNGVDSCDDWRTI